MSLATVSKKIKWKKHSQSVISWIFHSSCIIHIKMRFCLYRNKNYHIHSWSAIFLTLSFEIILELFFFFKCSNEWLGVCCWTLSQFHKHLSRNNFLNQHHIWDSHFSFLFFFLFIWTWRNEGKIFKIVYFLLVINNAMPGLWECFNNFDKSILMKNTGSKIPLWEF